MDCIYNCVGTSVVAFFLWEPVTNIAAVMTHYGISHNRYGISPKFDLFSNSLWVCVI
jgi:hypothetical protein